MTSGFLDVRDQDPNFDTPAPVNEDEDEILKRAIAMSLEEHSRVEQEEIFISDQEPGEPIVNRFSTEKYRYLNFQMSRIRSHALGMKMRC